MLQVAAIGLLALALALVHTVWRYNRIVPVAKGKESKASDDKDGRQAITAIGAVDISQLPIEQFRPYKPVYHTAMAIQSATMNEIFLADTNYLERLRYRRSLIETDMDEAIGHLPKAHAAVQELYSWIVSEWLPTRWPQHFSLSGDRTQIRNSLLNVDIPVKSPTTAFECIKTLMSYCVEEDLLVLLPIEGEDPVRYHLVAYGASGPTGFSWKRKLGLALVDIHGPVPEYKQKLEKSMDRYFAKLEVGKPVKRFNWNVATHSKLFSPDANHLKEGDIPQEADSTIIKDSVLRVERQTLSRLPKTGAILFSVKSYLYPLSEVKKEGSGPALATAIDGFPEKMAFYKARPVWGKVVKEYLLAN